MTVLHLGCGRKKVDAAELYRFTQWPHGTPDDTVIHLDADARLEPDLVCALGYDPIPMAADSVDLVIAWHVLEHIGQQGRSVEWFAFWEDLYRVMKHGAFLYGECPYYTGIWAWSDPTHSRAMSEHSFVFFSQAAYGIPESSISPYRLECDFCWGAMPGLERGFKVLTNPADSRDTVLRFALSAVKPLKPWWVH